MAVQETLKNTLLAKSGGVPTSTDVVGLNGFVLISPKVSTGEIDAIGTGALGNKKGYVDPQKTIATFDIPTVMRATSLGVPPELDELFKISGLSETIVADTRVTYSPGGITTGIGTVKVYNDGYVRTVSGCAAKLKITGKIGEPVKAVFNISGYTTPNAIAESNPMVTLNSCFIPIVSKISAVTLSGNVINCDTFELDVGNEINDTYATSMSEFYIGNFKPTLQITAVKTKGVDEGSWGDMGNGSLKEIIITIGGYGSEIVIDAPYAFYSEMSEADDKGRVKLTRKFNCENGGLPNANFSITYK